MVRSVCLTPVIECQWQRDVCIHHDVLLYRRTLGCRAYRLLSVSTHSRSHSNLINRSVSLTILGRNRWVPLAVHGYLGRECIGL